MDDDVMEWACKAAEAEYKLRQAIAVSGLRGQSVSECRERFEMRGDRRATQIFEAAVSELLDSLADHISKS
jgi:hypothetical protein